MFNEFKKLKALIKKQLGLHIASLRYDTGGEFYLKDFNNFFAKHGIQRQYTTPYTPQQNVLVERQKCTITKMARCKLQRKSIPNWF